NVTKRSYDATNKLISQVNALGQETRYEYDQNDRLVRVIDARNNATQLGYDGKGRLVSVTDALGNTRRLSYDAGDNLLQRIDALGNPVAVLSYDVLDNPLTVSDGLGNISQFEYDAASRLTGSVDPAEKATQFSYDDLDRLLTSVDAAGKTSSQAFDKDGNRTQLTDPNANQTKFEFDKSGRLLRATTAAGGSVQYSYSASDLLKTVINARGQARQFEYDAGGRLIRATDADGVVTYSYDANDNVQTVTSGDAVISREYDELGRVVKYTDSQGNVIQYAYDLVGNLVRLTYPDGKRVSYEYDAADRLLKVTDWANRVTRYSYDANGRLIREMRPNGTFMTREYDAAGQLVQQKDVDVEGELIRQFNFAYDAAGNITQEMSLPESALVPVRSVVMTYKAANRADTYRNVTVVQEKDFLFDADGNLTWGPLERGSLKRKWVEFEYDVRNRLVKAGETVYRYDAEDRRVAVRSGEQETRFVVNSRPALSQVLVKSENGQRTFYVYGLGLIGQEADGDYRAYHFDLRGSTAALSDVEGEVVERFHYSPYGDVVSHHPKLVDVPFLYNGRDGVVTDDSGLLYMRARFYNTDLRRFVNQDVLLGGVAEGQTLNRYAYVTGDPVRFIDPFGLWKTKKVSRGIIATVEAGDTLSGLMYQLLHDPEIALIRATEVANENGIEDPNLIHVGQEIFVSN
ncbi:MAG: RHS repeat protein, partial [Planctomycetes bacterium]|nr:RHS repeat protein [Planctomycetota bacterium]